MKKTTICEVIAIALMYACSSGGDEPGEIPTPPTPTPSEKLPIRISTVMGDTGNKRVTDFAFEAGDQAGLYVVNRKEDGTAAPLQPYGNHVDNMKFTYNGTWDADSPIYWKNELTHADFYLYSPYTTPIDNVESMPFHVNADQSTETAYKACDLLVGSALDIAPTENAVSITAYHILSQMVISLVPGNGFTAESLAAADVSVKINGIKTNATVNLATATATATGETETVTPWLTNGEYKALIVPQSVGQGLFALCEKLQEVSLPASAEVIEKDAFLGCSSLTRLDIPANAREVTPSDGCTKLSHLGISPANLYYHSVDGVLFDAGVSEIVWFPYDKSGDYALPSSITAIGDYAFRGCNITKFTLPEGLKELGQGTFYGSMVEEVVTPASLRLLPTATFQACQKLKTVRLGSGMELISDYAFDGCPLEHLYVEAVYPPVCNPDAFSTSYTDLFKQCILHVPANRLGFYKNDPTWGQFKNITGF